MSKPRAAGLTGHTADPPVVEKTLEVLTALEVPFEEVKIASAHRTPDVTPAYVKDAGERVDRLSIAAAGSAGTDIAGCLPTRMRSLADAEFAGRVRAERQANAEPQDRL